MSLATTIRSAATRAVVDHGQLALLRKRDDTFDKVEGGWKSGKVTNYTIHFVPEEFSDMAKAGGQLAGDLKIHVPASELDFTPYVGGATQRHLEVYFGDWETAAEVKESTATDSGIITEVGRAARYRHVQALWTLTVRTGGKPS
jgi:hypothetical protein